MTNQIDHRKLLYFPSGSNRPCDFIGFADIQMAPGVTVSAIGDSDFPTDDAIELLTGVCDENNLPCFVDSGAFSEVDRDLTVVAPIDHDEWVRRLSIYKRIATELGGLAYLVGPDQVGNQDVTLQRLTTYKDEVNELINLGANVMVVLQRGSRSLNDFRKAAIEALGCDDNDIVIALPMAKGATSKDALVDLLKNYQPQKLHLLGLGPNSRVLPDFVAVINDLAPRCLISHDSCYIRQYVGYKDAAKTQPKVLTAARYDAVADLEGTINCEPVCGQEAYLARLRGDYTDMIGSPSFWMKKKGLERLAESMKLDRDQKREFYADPDGFIQQEIPGTEIAWYEDPCVEWEIEQEWAKFHDDTIVPVKQYQGIKRAFPIGSARNFAAPANRRNVRRFIRESKEVTVVNYHTSQGFKFEVKADFKNGEFLIIHDDHVVAEIVGNDCIIQVENRAAVAIKWVWDHADCLPGQIEIA